MPIRRQKHDFEAGDELIPEVSCASASHKVRFTVRDKKKTNPPKNEENTQKKEQEEAWDSSL